MSHKVNDEVWAHASGRIRTTSLVVLLKMADAANDDRMLWESIPTIAKRTGLTDRAVRKSIRELEELRIVESVPKDQAPAEASRYRAWVRRIRPVEDWLFEVNPEPGSAPNPEPGSAPNPEPGSVTGGNPEPRSPNPNYITSNRDIGKTTSFPPRRLARCAPDGAEEIPRPGARGWEAVRPLRGPGGRRKSRRQQELERIQAEKETDPAYIAARLLGEDAPEKGSDAAVTASDDLVDHLVRTGRKTRSRRPSEQLADFFDREARRVGTDVPGATNLKALTGSFGRWMAQGTDYTTIRQMIETYWSSAWRRSDAAPAWRDFLASRGMLAKQVGKQAQAAMVEANRYDEDAW